MYAAYATTPIFMNNRTSWRAVVKLSVSVAIINRIKFGGHVHIAGHYRSGQCWSMLFD